MKVTSLRTRILLITCLTVVGALILSGITTYVIVRDSMMSSIAHTLSAVANGNASAIERWSADKAQAVVATSQVVEKGDPAGLVKLMGKTNDFPITSIGWSDKTFFSTAPTPADYDPTARPWYKSAVAAGKLTVTKPYGDSSTGIPYVAFTAPLVRDGQTTGAISGAVALTGVQDIIKAVHPTPSSLALVVASDGQVIAHPDNKFSLKPSTEVAAALTADSLPGMAADGAAPVAMELAGAPKLLKAKRIPGTDWYLVVALDRAEATAGLTHVLGATVITLIVLTLISLAIASIFTSRAFKRLSTVRDAMDTIGSGDGDMTQRLDVVGHDEVAQISKSFNAFVDKISSVMLDVRAGVSSMTSATSEIEMGNRDLSQRTEASAGSLQETSSALTELTSSVKQTADTAEHATRLANDASAAAARGGQVVTDAVGTMAAITQSSERITEIIGVIDGIAFQTNILALNAAVEAARAGEQGRGFAVVAGEVRTLAQRSAAAAQEIKALIETSVHNVKSGTERVQAAGTTMNEIVDGITRVQRLVSEIHGAMTEQSAGISQIDRSVSEMDQATQQNAALVEESAAASAMLSEQARMLAETVARFRLREGHRSDSHGVGAPQSPSLSVVGSAQRLAA
ncbi:HAMP domain-containing protein [Pandoraea fibrosis]|uniref:HAMP domain-containing protein n=1 Tax=Pandoraea fibrosis TaxID=1891094 RepID=A0ABX6HK79_9BURK|nr:methyl-accepting chemotaxis protein [Pandoraea fibrosis]QHE90429.1 HAMP domain-containing protein [Pandoraea fibrosis]QHF11261.1 HAMP domain-containing protein [Pandoraea fibrosis]